MAQKTKTAPKTKQVESPFFPDGGVPTWEIAREGVEDAKPDWEEKRLEYAKAGIAECWIVDPQKKVIRVLKLVGKSYKVHGDFGPGSGATSALLPGFSVPVDEVLSPEGAS